MDPLTIMQLLSASAVLTKELVKIMEERRRNKELTPEQEAEWDRFKGTTLNLPHWQPSNVKPA